MRSLLFRKLRCLLAGHLCSAGRSRPEVGASTYRVQFSTQHGFVKPAAPTVALNGAVLTKFGLLKHSLGYEALGEHQLWLESTALSDQHARLRRRHRRVPEARGSAHAARRLRRRSLLRERLVHANRRVRSPRWWKVLLGPPLAAQLLLRSSRVASGGFRD